MFEILRQVQPKPRPTLNLKEPLQTSTRIRFSLQQIEICQNSKRNLSGVSNGIYRRTAAYASLPRFTMFKSIRAHQPAEAKAKTNAESAGHRAQDQNRP